MNTKDNNEMELCLCRACASSFYNIHEYRIRRKDPYQFIKEPCTYCGFRFGYDFIIARKMSSVRMFQNVRNRIIERIPENQYTAHKLSTHSTDAR